MTSALRCPICRGRRGGVRLESPWLTVSCGNCGRFRITIAAAAVLGLYALELRKRVSWLTHSAWLDETPLELDVEEIDRLLSSD